MNPKLYLTNKHFCPIPWTGIMYNFDGNVKNCIRSSQPIGNIQDKSIEDIVGGVQNLTTKMNMIINESVDRCSPCYNLEKEKNSFEIISDRVFYLREFKSEPLDLYKDPTKFDLKTLDIRWSNLCNFACIYCGPDFSSRWQSELEIQIQTPSAVQVEKFVDYVYKNVKQLKHVYLAGGEPLLMKENLQLVETLYKENPDVNLRVNTNLSKVDTKIFDKICDFKNVHWIVSVETIDQEYEYIRYGGVWNDFIDNLDIIRKLNHKISFNMLHFALNSLSIFKCVDFLKGMGFHNNSFIIGPLHNPVYLNIRQLPDHMLTLVKNTLISRLDEKPGYLLENGYKNMLTHINEPFDKDTKQLFEYLKTLDKSRNLDSTKIFKELYNYGNQTF